MPEAQSDDETQALAWPKAARAIQRNATILKAAALDVVLVAFVSLAIVLSTAGIYLRSWELEFKIQELKDPCAAVRHAAPLGSTAQEWSLGAVEKFRGCEARQREDFTRSDKEIYEQCISTHPYDRDKHCQRGKDRGHPRHPVCICFQAELHQMQEIRIFVFNVTNPADVVEGLTPRIREVPVRCWM
eukprot:Skav230090  [mRNA]  locus=scaffold3264:11244:15155:- [translate_table: standard]